MRSRLYLPAKKLCIMLIFCALLGLFPSYAAENQYSDGLGSAIDSLPEEVIDALPEDMDSLIDSPERVTEIFDLEYMIGLSSGLLKNALSSALKTFAFIAAVTLISTVLSSVGKAFSPGSSGMNAWDLASTLCVGACTYSMIWSHLSQVREFAHGISSFMKSLTAVFGGVYLSAGEVGSASLHSVWIFSITSVTEELCGNVLFPMMQISFAATLSSSVLSGVNISRLVQMIRNIFTSLTVFFMTLISVILAFQTVIAHSSDSLAMRGVRYAISHSVPIIGALVSDSARTLATGFSLMKNSVGFIGIAVIIVLSLYPLVGLLASRFALQLASAFSSMISEGKGTLFLDESVKMINFLIAVMIIIDVAFIFCVSVFALLPASGA